jgi:hypothetical protein
MGFTGVNADQANMQINLFIESMSAISSSMESAGNNLFNKLKANWYSPSAVDFSSSYSTYLYQNTVEIIRANAYMIANSAKEAVNSMLVANGGAPITKEYTYVSSDHDFGSLLSAGDRGVGMEINAVMSAINDYSAAVTNNVLSLDKVPMNLSLFDEHDAIVSSFQDTIKKTIETIRTASSDATKAITNIVQSEGTKLQFAAQNSAQLFNGMGHK